VDGSGIALPREDGSPWPHDKKKLTAKEKREKIISKQYKAHSH